MKYIIIIYLLHLASIHLLGQSLNRNCDAFLSEQMPRLDSIKIVFLGPGALSCVLPDAQRLWLKGDRTNNQSWLVENGLLDSIEVILNNQTIFKGQLVDFYQIEEQRFMFHEHWYFNLGKQNVALLLIVNYSRQHYKIAILPLGVSKSIVIYSPTGTETRYLAWGWDSLLVTAEYTKCLFEAYQKK
jgi:hypothetical protein